MDVFLRCRRGGGQYCLKETKKEENHIFMTVDDEIIFLRILHKLTDEFFIYVYYILLLFCIFNINIVGCDLEKNPFGKVVCFLFRLKYVIISYMIISEYIHSNSTLATWEILYFVVIGLRLLYKY